MNTTSMSALALLAILLAAPAAAQQPGTSGTTTMSSEPGQAKVVRTIKISAEVVAIDKGTRALTLKGPQDKPVNVIAGEEVKNFNRIKVGDVIVVRYAQALALKLRKTRAVGDVTEREGSTQAEPGERPGAASVHQITAIAEVMDVDPRERTITLKGPLGNIVELDVQNPDQFKLVKKGDQVDVTYTQALAVSVEPGPGEKK